MAVAVKRATLFDPKTGQRTAVDIGSTQERQLFKGGYQLETPTNKYSAPTTAMPTPAPATPTRTLSISAPTPTTNAQGLTMDQANDPKYWKDGKYVGTVQPGTEAASAAYAKQTPVPFGSNGFVAPTTTTSPEAAPVNPYKSYNDALASLLKSAREGGGNLNEDLLQQRNALITSRFNTRTELTPEQLRSLSPEQQASLRSGNVSGLNDQLGGVDAALKSREAAQNEARSYLKDFNDSYQKQFEPTQVGDNLVRLNPETGQYEIVYQGPTKAESAPATVQEYQYAVSQGFTGSFLDYQTAKNAASVAGKEPTKAAYDAYGYATRMDNSSKIIDELDQNFTGATGQGFSWMPELLKTEDRKSIEQAERDFVNANLRRESGAAISPIEFESAEKQYFPQAGDTEAILAQKKLNREITLNSIKLEAQTVYAQQGISLNGPSSNGQNDAAKKSGFEAISGGIKYEDAVKQYGQTYIDNFLQESGVNLTNVGGDTKKAASSGSPLEIANSYLGLNAGNSKQAQTLSAFFKKAGGINIDPATTAWCAAFANSVLGAAGIKGTGSTMAQSFLKFGTPINKPTKGDIVVFERGARGSGLGHVGFVTGINSNGTIQVLGGNQSNRTSIETFKTDRVLGYRRINIS